MWGRPAAYIDAGNHMRAGSSFTNIYLSGDGSVLRAGCGFRYLLVEDRRRRSLLEAYAAGCLCPIHIGHRKPKEPE